MKVIVAGAFRVPPGNLQRLRSHMMQMIRASRCEEGCMIYSYGEDAGEPGLVRVFEVWRDQAALDAHTKTDHIAAWRAAWPALGVCDRRLTVYEVASEKPF